MVGANAELSYYLAERWSGILPAARSIMRHAQRPDKIDISERLDRRQAQKYAPLVKFYNRP